MDVSQSMIGFIQPPPGKDFRRAVEITIRSALGALYQVHLGSVQVVPDGAWDCTVIPVRTFKIVSRNPSASLTSRTTSDLY
jgi:hypothetical protein